MGALFPRQRTQGRALIRDDRSSVGALAETHESGVFRIVVREVLFIGVSPPGNDFFVSRKSRPI